MRDGGDPASCSVARARTSGRSSPSRTISPTGGPGYTGVEPDRRGFSRRTRAGRVVRAAYPGLMRKPHGTGLHRHPACESRRGDRLAPSSGSGSTWGSRSRTRAGDNGDSVGLGRRPGARTRRGRARCRRGRRPAARPLRHCSGPLRCSTSAITSRRSRPSFLALAVGILLGVAISGKLSARGQPVRP